MTTLNNNLESESLDLNDPSTLVEHFPVGAAWESARKEGTIQRDLITGWSKIILRVEKRQLQLAEAGDITNNTLLINEWERRLGIPDKCFSGTGTIEDRQKDIICKTTLMHGNRIEDLKAVCAFYEIDCEITPATIFGFNDYNTYEYPFTYVDSSGQELFNHVNIALPAGNTSGFDYNFSYEFEGDTPEINKLKCILETMLSFSTIPIYIVL